MSNASEIKARQNTSNIFATDVPAPSARTRANPTNQSTFMKEDVSAASTHKSFRTSAINKDSDIFGTKTTEGFRPKEAAEKPNNRNTATYKSNVFERDPNAPTVPVHEERPKTSKYGDRPQFVPKFDEMSAKERAHLELYGASKPKDEATPKTTKAKSKAESEVTRTAFEQKRKENISSIFGEDNASKYAGGESPTKGAKKTSLVKNEKAENFAEEMKHEMAKSSVFSTYDDNKPTTKAPTPAPASGKKGVDLSDHYNEDLRRKNHNYSDLFGQCAAETHGTTSSSKKTSKIASGADWKDTKTEDTGKTVDVKKEMFIGSPENPLNEPKNVDRDEAETRKTIQQERKWQAKNKEEAGLWREGMNKTRPTTAKATASKGTKKA